MTAIEKNQFIAACNELYKKQMALLKEVEELSKQYKVTYEDYYLGNGIHTHDYGNMVHLTQEAFIQIAEGLDVKSEYRGDDQIDYCPYKNYVIIDNIKFYCISDEPLGTLIEDKETV